MSLLCYLTTYKKYTYPHKDPDTPSILTWKRIKFETDRLDRFVMTCNFIMAVLNLRGHWTPKYQNGNKFGKIFRCLEIALLDMLF